MPLAEEREILKQMSKLERVKRQVEDYESQDKLVKEKKVRSDHYNSCDAFMCLIDAFDPKSGSSGRAS